MKRIARNALISLLVCCAQCTTFQDSVAQKNNAIRYIPGVQLRPVEQEGFNQSSKCHAEHLEQRGNFLFE